MLLLIMLYSTCLCITEDKMSGLNSNQPWSLQFQLNPSLLISLKVESDDVINNWSGRIFNGFHNLMVRLWRFTKYAYNIQQWASCQVPNMRAAHAPAMLGTFPPKRGIAILACITICTYVRHARALIHAGIAYYRFPLKSLAGKTTFDIFIVFLFPHNRLAII